MEIFELMFWFVIEMLPQVIAELMFEFGLEAVGKASLTPKRSANPFLAGIGYVLLGMMSGSILSTIFPYRLVPKVNLHGLSAILAAAGSGFVMMHYGRWRSKKGGKPTYLATFWGGALFAFSMTFTRWLIVRAL